MTETKKRVKSSKAAQSHNESVSQKQLFRSKDNQMIAGVCGGLGEYFSVDPVVVRLLFVLATFFGGFGIPLYIIMWIILPEESSGKIGSEETVRSNVAHLRSTAEGFASGLRSGSTEGRTRTVLGVILIGFGVMIVLDRFGFFRADVFWPLILVVLGLLILRPRKIHHTKTKTVSQ